MIKTTVGVWGFSLIWVSSLTWGQFPTANYDPVTGIMSIDSDGIDLVAVFIEGPDVSQGMGCNLCDGMNLPAEDPSGFDASSWTLGFINGSSQWIRTNPLQGRGFVGTIADSFIDGTGNTQPWPDDFPPFLDFPDVGGGIANYGSGLSLGDFGLVTFASDDGSVYTYELCGLSCNRPPIANDDEYFAGFGTTLDVAAPGLLENDLDPDGDDLMASLAVDPIYGDVMVNTDGSFTYIAPPVGTLPPGTIDTFTYTATDYASNTDDATVSITLVFIPEPQGCTLLLGLLLGLHPGIRQQLAATCEEWPVP
ncbi:MAG: Ig-like domain-containing protein [Planctomycetota bacterium]